MIEQALGALAAAGQAYEAFYLRTSDQYELDLVLDFGTERWAVEIKLTSAPTSRDLKRLEVAADWVDAKRRFLVSQTKRPVEGERTVSCDLPAFLAHVTDR